MGIFDGFFRIAEEVWDIGKDAVTGAAQIASETTAEFKELATTGFKEMVIEGNTEYKTSFEKRDEARRIIGEARQGLENKVEALQAEHKALCERLEVYKKTQIEALRDDAQRWLNLTEPRVSAQEWVIIHHEQQQTYRYLQFISPAQLREFIRKSSDLFTHSKAVAEQTPEVRDYHPTLRIPVMNGSPILGGLSDLIEQSRRIQAADEDLEDAKDFKVKARMEVERLTGLHLEFKAVADRIHEGQTMLHDFRQALQPLIEKLANRNRGLTLEPTDLGTLGIGYVLVMLIFNICQAPLLDEQTGPSQTTQQLFSQIREDQASILDKVHQA